MEITSIVLKHKERQSTNIDKCSFSSLYDWQNLMLISTNNSDRSDPTVVEHRTWVENGFSQQAIVIVRLISGFHHWITSFLAVSVCKSANNARKVLNNAFLMLFFSKSAFNAGIMCDTLPLSPSLAFIVIREGIKIKNKSCDRHKSVF